MIRHYYPLIPIVTEAPNPPGPSPSSPFRHLPLPRGPGHPSSRLGCPGSIIIWCHEAVTELVTECDRVYCFVTTDTLTMRRATYPAWAHKWVTDTDTHPGTHRHTDTHTTRASIKWKKWSLVLELEYFGISHRWLVVKVIFTHYNLFTLLAYCLACLSGLLSLLIDTAY